MSYTPSADAQAIATQIGSNMAALASPLTAMQSSIAGGNLAPAALADGLLQAIGYQAQNDAAGLGTASTSSTTFVDVGNGSSTGFSTWTFTAPISKTYLIHVDLGCYMSVIGAVPSIAFQLLVDGSAPGSQPVNSMTQTFNTANLHTRFSFRIPVSLAAGARVLKLQWKVGNAANTAVADVNDFRCFTVTG